MGTRSMRPVLSTITIVPPSITTRRTVDIGRSILAPSVSSMIRRAPGLGTMACCAAGFSGVDDFSVAAGFSSPGAGSFFCSAVSVLAVSVFAGLVFAAFPVFAGLARVVLDGRPRAVLGGQVGGDFGWVTLPDVEGWPAVSLVVFFP